MKNSIRILILDDHPVVIKGYELFLTDDKVKYNIELEGAQNCAEALNLIKKYKNDFFDIVLLDIRLPASENSSVMNGEDLGLRIRSKFPQTKIIVHTALNNQQRISTIFKSLNPEGFLIKSDIEPNILIDAVNTVIQNERYYSESVNKLLEANNFDDLHIDSLDRKILYYLSIGERMKNLPKYIPLSMATIERRKRNLKSLFDLMEDSDRKLLEVAKEKGFV